MFANHTIVGISWVGSEYKDIATTDVVSNVFAKSEANMVVQVGYL